MGIDELMAFVLVLVRVGTIFAFLPFLGDGVAPKVVKAAAVLVISVGLFPALGVRLNVVDWQPLRLMLLVLAEGIFGALTGFGAMVIFKSIRMAGELFGRQMGMALAITADPINGVQATVMGNFCELVGSLLFFVVGGHRWMLLAIHDSFLSWPLGGFLDPVFIKQVALASVLQCFSTAFNLAAPLLLLMFMVTLSMAVIARLVPEINIMIVGFPVRIGAGLIGVTLLLPHLVYHYNGVVHTMIEFMLGAAGGS